MNIHHSNEIKSIQDALGTDETGETLIEIARNAHIAEQELAALIILYRDNTITNDKFFEKFNELIWK